jgi:hypothetical protein
MLDEGYAAVSSRRVAHRLGFNAALVYYYFENMDDLFLTLSAAWPMGHSNGNRLPWPPPNRFGHFGNCHGTNPTPNCPWNSLP